MGFVVEHLAAEVRQIVPRNIDSALVKIEQPYPALFIDPDVCVKRVAVDHRPGKMCDRSENGEHLIGYLGRKLAHFGIDTRAGVSELRDRLTPRSLRKVSGVLVQLLQSDGHVEPILVGLGWTPLKPTLRDDAVDVAATIRRGNDGGHPETATIEMGNEVELPVE